MTAKGLKTFLISFVGPEHQNFHVRFALNKRTRFAGDYLQKTRVITIYPDKIRDRFDLLATGLHELAHHLTWEVPADDGHRAMTERRRARHHGKDFCRCLKQLTRIFNLRHGERVKGFMFCSSRRPSRSPKFVKFSVLEPEIHSTGPGGSVAHAMSSYASDKGVGAKPGRKVVMVGFNRRKGALMYSGQTRKFDYKIPGRWMKLLCSYAAATPKPGELWEFGVSAKRILNASGRRVD